MFKVDKTDNRIHRIEEKSFSELGIRERENLQEWLEHNPEVFGEEILIIQKEFDGFDDTRERLDLLALDKQGNIIVIENKLDDSGRDVTWQVLKYASYCSSLSKHQIKDIYQSYLDRNGIEEDAKANLEEFLEVEFPELQTNKTQRIILVSASFRKEVTSTVMWLLTTYNMKIQCFKAVPYLFNDDILLSVDQIIPVKEAEEYTIRMAEKAQDQQSSQDTLKARQKLNLEFWKKYLTYFSKRSNLLDNVSPSKDSWISTGSGISGIAYNSVISNSYARAELYFSRPVREENKFIFDKLLEMKSEIESTFGDVLTWERMDNKKSSRIKYELNEVSISDPDKWQQMIEFMANALIRLEAALQQPIKKAGRLIKSR